MKIRKETIFLLLLLLCALAIYKFIPQNTSSTTSSQLKDSAILLNAYRTGELPAVCAGQNATSHGPHTVDDHLLKLYLRKLRDVDGLKPVGIPRFCPSPLTGHRPPCVVRDCNVTVASPQLRLQRALEFSRSIPADHAAWIDNLAGHPNFTDLVFLTGATDNHFRESQGTIRDLEQKLYPVLRQQFPYLTYRLVFIDLGLSPARLAVLNKSCDCTVIKFPFHKMPRHLQHPKTYSWKVVVIKAHLRFSSLTIWMDASTRLAVDAHKLNALRDLLGRGPGICMTQTTWSMGMHTHPSTVTSLQAPPLCQLVRLNELASGLLVIKNEELVRRTVVDPWVACALSPHCLCPSPDGQDCRTWYSCKHSHAYFRCHRFDQSALGVILYSLYPQHMARISRACHALRLVFFKRGDGVDYLKTR